MIVALCPTFRRPNLAGNAAACFLAQKIDLPHKLIIWEDGGALKAGRYGSVQVVTSGRFPNLGAKYNALAKLAITEYDADYLAVWEDDDIYLPHYLEAHILALTQSGAAWSKPSRVLSLYTGKLEEEPAAGRFHASILLTRRAWESVRWPENGRADFDQQLMASLTQKFGPPADPLTVHPVPGYIFRYGSTGAYHAQFFMRGPDDTSWYQAVQEAAPPLSPEDLRIAFDKETGPIYKGNGQWRIPDGRA
ncbi:MAG TPA: hypothetical protein PK349_11610 [Candidatus Hydrogenedentes bacterium]|nr:hypothetical protein [Candidatus Hydrogenedentota bacterium]